MNVTLLTNNTDSATVQSGIRGLIAAAHGIDVAVSYIQVSGWHALSDIIDDIDDHHISPNRVRILVTDQFDLTHPEALKLAFQKRVQLRSYAGNKIYHPKVYLARDAENKVSCALVGSANLSDSGLRGGIEGAVVIRDSQEVLAAIGNWFDERWNTKSDVIDVDRNFISEYRSRWRIAARARVKLRRFRRKITGIVAPTDGHLEDIQVLEDVCQTIRNPIVTLGMDQAGNNIRNLNRLLAVLRKFPTDIHDKARSELHLLGLVDGNNNLTAVGLQCRQCTTTRALARAWCQWVKDEPEQSLLDLNPKIETFRRAATLFWKLRWEVRNFFFRHLEEEGQRDILKAIEILCNAGDLIRELKLEDFRALAPILATQLEKLPKHLRDAIRKYNKNKGDRSWKSDDRRILLKAWRYVQ
jgi:HKD family nuclease